MSSRSHPAVHPLDVEIPQLTEPAAAAAAAENDGRPDDRVRMKDIQGMPGTPTNLALRLFQFAFAAVSVAVMAATSDFPSVTAFRYLVAALSLQCLWSLSLAIVDIYALLVKRSLRNPRIVAVFTIGDGITSTLTFAAACASAGITVLIGNDFNNCSQNHCTRFETSTAMAFVSWFAVSPSFFLNFWYLASG
ncbi:putative casparian strip membrane protein [Helianthus debilis subsp. tardiflorus]